MNVELSRGALTAVARPEGGELISLRDGQGMEYIWQGDPAVWAGRNPNLFPIVGALRNDQVRMNGKAYSMGRHGFAKASLFTAVEQGRDYVVFELRESASTLCQYPYAFRLRIRHQLLEDGFCTQYEVLNPGEVPLPFCVGGHPAFRCPLRAEQRFEDCRLVFDQPETASAMVPLPGGILSPDRVASFPPQFDSIPLSHGLFDRVDTLVFEGLRSRQVSLVGPDGHGVRLSFGDFPMVAFWTMAHANAPYLCLEPWHGCGAMEDEDGEFTHKPHCITLEPGGIKILRYTVTIL